MLSVYFSHVGEINSLTIHSAETVKPGTLLDIIYELEERHQGISEQILNKTKDQISSSVLIFKHIEIGADHRFLEGEQSLQVKSLDESISDRDQNLLIALFHPQKIMAFLLETLTNTPNRKQEYRSYISSREDNQGSQPLFVEAQPEPLYPFVSGRLISNMVTDNLIDISHGKVIPVALRNAIARLWEIDTDFRLRLFQEDALIHILKELAQPTSSKAPLLLSIPTGGGKTEAFLIPLIAHLYNQREQQLRAGYIPAAKVRSMVIYPTRALANDQARRIAEILYSMNCDAIEDCKISVGVLTGDTPSSSYNLLTEKSLLQLCPHCSTVLTNFPEKEIQGKNTKVVIARCICGAEIDYFRLTRQDILNYPPDILITSPDMINRMLQSPRYHSRIFSPDVDLVVFDEVHMYDSVFGCNVAHLLRRFEEACRTKPLYVGVSATIRNAKELACLIFDAGLDEVRYLRPKRREEVETDEKRPYLDYQAQPTRYRYHYAVAPSKLPNGKEQKVITSVLNVADTIGHLFRDPHFRKTLIFSNFRQDTDDIVRYLRDQEDRYYSTYHQKLFPRIVASQQAQARPLKESFTKTESDIIAAIDRWYQRANEIGALYECKLEIGWHRGGLERDERIKSVNRFSSAKQLKATGEANAEFPIDIMVATSTLELGIDIGDVTTVMNSSAPFTTNEYTQRVGRGGRRKDSLALTIVDPHNPLDHYFLKNFEHYAHPVSDDFEDAPIIISNIEVIKSHIYARILDWLAQHMSPSNKEEIQASDLRSAFFSIEEHAQKFQDDWEAVSKALFSAIFTPERIEQLRTWIRREAKIIEGICETDLGMEELHSRWLGKCEQLYKRICTSDGDIRDTDYLSGMETKDRELVPDLRSSGPSVGIYLIREGRNDELSDTLSRKQAIISRPLGAYASQGSVTFKVDSIKEEDPDAAVKIKQLFVDTSEGTKAVAYFHHMFGDADNRSLFPSKPLDAALKLQFRTPKNLAVKYNPYRFYCPRCGATYSNKQAGDDHCIYCHAELRQLTEVYICGGCGEIYVPPVPKVCINPSCIEKASSYKDKSPFMPQGYKRVGKHDHHNDYFRFTALPLLTWQCNACGTEINYHSFYKLDPALRRQLENVPFGTDNAQQIAKTFLFRPESWIAKNYVQEGFQPARFNCKKCGDSGRYNRIHVKNIPSFRTVVHEYIVQSHEMAPSIQKQIGSLDFKHVSVVALGREYFRRFYSYSENEFRIDQGAIFPNRNDSYLADIYDTHAAFFRFERVLEQFLESSRSIQTCQLGANCPCHQQDIPRSEDNSGDTDTTKPTPAMLSWELGRKPDPRRKWCRVVQNLVPDKKCPGEQALCMQCQHFDKKYYQRYLILHTLEHAIITAMPKYTGINRNQVRGMIYPNDEQHYDLGLLDSTSGGSGCFYLLGRNWDRIWQMVGELIDAAQGEGSQLLLPYTCTRHNRDLCPHLALEFYRYASQ
jgi:ATP-dependent helicase YprA (DUF1998 family)